MEITCTRCHQTVQADNCYCSHCGLPQLVYTTDGSSGQVQPERGEEATPDAGSIAWKPALNAALKLAVPAGVLCAILSPLGLFGSFWMAVAATWAVALYLRSQRPAWITIGVGARIGLVTGLLGGWLAFGVSGGQLFIQRFFLHQSNQIDASWRAIVESSQQLTLQMGFSDAAQLQSQKAFMLSPEGHAGFTAISLVFNWLFLTLFAVVGGALGARMMGRSRQPEI
ncbi:MAG TPA: hypothetical protein VGF01_05365 [Terracidiphilus sp.]